MPLAGTHKCIAGHRSETCEHSRFRRTIIGTIALMMAGTIIVGLVPLSAEAQTSPQPLTPQTAPAYPYQQPPAAQGAYPYSYYYPYYYPYWAYGNPSGWGWGYPLGWGWPIGVSVGFGGCFNCGFRGAFFHPGFRHFGFGHSGFFHPGFGRFGFGHPGFFHPGFARFGFGHPGLFHPGFGHFGFAHAGFGGGFRGGGRR